LIAYIPAEGACYRPKFVITKTSNRNEELRNQKEEDVSTNIHVQREIDIRTRNGSRHLKRKKKKKREEAKKRRSI
jgi:hypothetical protein